jgi:hypothetical protein
MNKLWTALENFEEVFLPVATACRGCGEIIPKTAVCLTRKPKKQNFKTQLALHSFKCWELWEQKYWLAKARYRQQLIKNGSGKNRALALGGYPLRGGVKV